MVGHAHISVMIHAHLFENEKAVSPMLPPRRMAARFDRSQKTL